VKVNYCVFRPLIPSVILLAACAFFSSLTGSASYFSASAQTVTTVNAASYATDNTVSTNSIAAAFGVFKTQNSQVYVASSVPLPKTLGGVKLTVGGVDAELFFTSTGQINYVVPPNTQNGATVVVTNSDNSTVSGTIKIAAAAPGLFSAKATGNGAAAAYTTDGTTIQTVADASGNENTLSAGTTAKPNYLILYATAIRNAPNTDGNNGNGVAESCKVTIQGIPCQIDYAGPAPGFVGADQINVKLSPEMAGLGAGLQIKLEVTTPAAPPPLGESADGGQQVDAATSNIVTMKLGGQLPDFRTTTITAGQTINGALTIDDQIDKDTSTGLTYFFDAYRFTATPNQGVAIDLRSSQFDATIIVYRINADNSITYVASDDLSGGISNGQKVNNNAMLLFVPPDNADYLILATTADNNPDGLGNYTIKLLGNVIQPITYGTTISNGSIATSDIQISTGDYWDAYWFQGTQGDKIQIDLTSTAFNAYLVLNKNNGDFVVDDDNSGGGTNARISPTSSPKPLASLPETGRYIIIATPFQPNVTGSYTLSLAKTGSPAEGTIAGEGADIALPQLPSRNTEDIFNQRGSNFERFARRRIIR